MTFLFTQGVFGGTFDHLHLGHKKLLDTAFAKAERVTIGVTTEMMYHHKFLAKAIQDFSLREQNLKKYLEEKGYSNRAEIITLTDIYGNTREKADIEAIFVTEENLPNVSRINEKRAELGFNPLQTILVPYVTDESGDIITSERIRKGDIDMQGKVYINSFKKDLALPESLRPQLQQLLGKLTEKTEDVIPLLDDKIIISVGDIISQALLDVGITPAIQIIDFKTRRENLTPKSIKNAFHTSNAPGTINREAVEALKKARDTYLQTQLPQTIIVSGEEDLLTLPAILLAPLESVVLYGQFDQGIVVNIVTAELKEKVGELSARFV